jgi:pimeloyl-ACP methyl ester carboxylesterase
VRRALRVFGRVLVALLLALMVLSLVFHRWTEAQGRGIIVLTRTSNTPLLGWIVGVLTDEPHAEETTIGGEPSLLVRPGEGRSWHAVVFLNGVTRRGRFHPTVRKLARALARAGYLVVVPDPPGLRNGALSTHTLAGAEAAIGALCRRPDVRGGQVALFGVSVGGSLALLAAEDPALARCVRLVAALAPYTNLADVVRISTTGTYVENHVVHRYRSKRFAALVAARSLAAALPPGADRSMLVQRLSAVPDDAHDPLAVLRTLPRRDVRPETRALVRLLTNRDPRRFDALYAAIPRRIKRIVAQLSPLGGAAELRTRVLIASAPHDKYFPPEQSRELARRARRVELTVTPTLQHAIPHFALGDLTGIVRFDEFLVRVLHRAG